MMKKSKKETDQCCYHLMVRIATGKGDPRFRTDDPVKAHNAIVAEHSQVFFGWAGQCVGKHKIQQIEHCLENGQPSSLIILRGKRTSPEFVAAQIQSIHTGDFHPPEKLIPKYYREHTAEIALWLSITTFRNVKERRIERLFSTASGRPLAEVAAYCRGPVISVQEIA